MASIEKGLLVNLTIRAKITAVIKLATGPDRDIKPASFRGFLRLKGSKPTGFAQPKTKGEPNKMRNKGTMIVP